MLLLLQRYFQVTLKNLKKDVKELDYSFILLVLEIVVIWLNIFLCGDITTNTHQ